MGSQVLSQQEFFIYMPQQHPVNVCKQKNSTDQEAKICLQEENGLPLLRKNRDNWVKIPLQGRVVVYARVWDAAHNTC
jgi:hypothetical protein